MASVALLAGSWFAISWLLGTPLRIHAKATTASDELDILKLVLAIVAGAGALVALVTAYRRQRLEEIASERAERIQAHAQLIAQENIHDATERRITELYSKAVEQLGHSKAAVRLGGLYSLERLGQQNETHRQVIVEVICAYLRMPYTPPKSFLDPDSPDQENSLESEASQEREVRRAAQDILAKHLRKYTLGYRIRRSSDEPPASEQYWPGVELNLQSAVLIDADFTECHFGDSSFDGCKFLGQTRFSGATFNGATTFGGAKFSGWAGFDGTEFYDYVALHDLTFASVADFRNSAFHRQFSLVRARFQGNTWFSNALFYADIRFIDRRFPQSNSEFSHSIDLSGAQMLDASEDCMLPSAWRMQPNGTGGEMVTDMKTSRYAPAKNVRPPYPREGCTPDPQWVR
ncbi:pentapeptide repeat-containing protein [Streptacidiphilus anmyonensis]|uniref:pentapeptide repeat-containing protein n=1 Tax=Streptacidiphilus anmyonensis TaxID=405782 RepID=UPI001364A5F5|nr:pentapeptide repeat-containing protein [Streptacidiphilus anmyonensis]